AALGPRVLNDEHNVMTVLIAQGGLGDAHGMFGRRRAGFAEGDLHAHLGQDARVQLVEADADLDGGFLAIGGGDDGDDFARDFPIGIGVERGFDRLIGFDAVDVAFVDVNLDFERAHVHNGSDAGAGESAAGGHGRNHLAGLGVLGGDDAVERRTNDEIVHLLLPHGHGALGNRDIALLPGQAAAEGGGIGFGAVEVGGGDDFLLGEIGDADELLFGLLEQRAGFVERGFGGVEL